MIIKARAGKGGQALARYLAGGKNERAEVLEYRNMDAPDLKAAIRDMDELGRVSQCENHALHVQMRAANGEHLTPEQWSEAADRYARAFGMDDHQAAVILHQNPDGSTHCHAVFNRVHPETLKAAHLGHNYAKHKKLAREMERDFNLQKVPSRKRDKARNYSDQGRNETEQAKRSGQSVHDIRDQIKSAWEQSDNGRDFCARLEAEGFTLAQGDRRDFVAVDAEGNPYSIGKRTTGAKAAEVRDKLADLDPSHMPTVEQAKQHQQERRQQTREGQSRPEAEPIKGQWNAANDQQKEGQAYRMDEANTPTAAMWKAQQEKAANQNEKPDAQPSQSFNQQTRAEKEKAYFEDLKHRYNAQAKDKAPEKQQERDGGRELSRERKLE